MMKIKRCYYCALCLDHMLTSKKLSCMEGSRCPLKKFKQPCIQRTWTNERSINLRLSVKVWPLKENSYERMVSSTRRKAKASRSLIVAKHLAFDAITVRGRVTQERCALNV